MGNAFVLALLYPTMKGGSLHAQGSSVAGQEDEIAFHEMEENEKLQEHFGSIWRNVFTSFNMMFMAFDIELLDQAYSPSLAKLLYVYYVVMVPLIMLNLLIALMGGEHDRVKDDEAWEGTRLRAELLLGFEKS
jgi:hypothetical protein